MAQVLDQLGRETEARQLFESLVNAFPGNATACMAYADLLMTQDQPDARGALDQYESILVVNPCHYRACSGKAASLLRLGDFHNAAIRLDSLLIERPDDVYLAFLLGSAHHHLRQHEQAVAAYKRAIDVLPPASHSAPCVSGTCGSYYMEAYGTYPGDLDPVYRIGLAPLDEESPDTSPISPPPPASARKTAAAASPGSTTTAMVTPTSSPLASRPCTASTAMTATILSAILPPNRVFLHPRGGWAAIAADYDADGYADLFTTREAWEGAGQLALQKSGQWHLRRRCPACRRRRSGR